MQELMDFITNNQEVIIAFIGAVASIISYFKGNKKAEEKGYEEGAKDGANIATNALKNDGKVESNGQKEIIRGKVIHDVEAIGSIISNNLSKADPKKAKKIKVATEKVSMALNNINDFNNGESKKTGIVKVGSHNGEPLYAEEIIEKVSKAKNIYDSLKNLF